MAGLRRVIGDREVVLRIHQVACVGVIVGYRNRNRVYGVWELGLPEDAETPRPSTTSRFHVGVVRRVGPGALVIEA